MRGGVAEVATRNYGVDETNLVEGVRARLATIGDVQKLAGDIMLVLGNERKSGELYINLKTIEEELIKKEYDSIDARLMPPSILCFLEDALGLVCSDGDGKYCLSLRGVNYLDQLGYNIQMGNRPVCSAVLGGSTS